jgi:hypothetical protein
MIMGLSLQPHDKMAVASSLKRLQEHKGHMRLFAFIFICLLGAASGFQIVNSHFGQVRTRKVLPAARRSPLFTPLAESTTEEDNLIAPSLPKWDPTNWTPKRLHNSPLFRSAALLGALALAGFSTKTPLSKISAKAGATINILSFGTWIGTVVYTTFVAGITMFKNLPRQTFGKLQAKLFPKYFSLCSVTILLQVRTRMCLCILPC